MQPDRPEQTPIQRLLALMARLRDPAAGCPWDLEQNFATIAPHTIEEAYEVADAVSRGNMEDLKGELGDLLFQVVFHARMAEEAKAFNFDAVTIALVDKMIHRHPHVFGSAERADSTRQTVAWETQKAEERAARAKGSGQAASALDDVTLGLPALTRAIKLQNRAARVGFDWPDIDPVFEKLDEELGELKREIVAAPDQARLADELGDVLFVVANLARHLKVDPEAALRGANAKFERRFRRVEGLLQADGRSPEQSTLAEMDRLWDQAKNEERVLRR